MGRRHQHVHAWVPASPLPAPLLSPRAPPPREAGPAVTGGACPPEYTITMYDTKTRQLRWNATYFDYAASEADLDHSECGPGARAAPLRALHAPSPRAGRG